MWFHSNLYILLVYPCPLSHSNSFKSWTPLSYCNSSRVRHPYLTLTPQSWNQKATFRWASTACLRGNWWRGLREGAMWYLGRNWEGSDTTNNLTRWRYGYTIYLVRENQVCSDHVMIPYEVMNRLFTTIYGIITVCQVFAVFGVPLNIIIFIRFLHFNMYCFSST